MTRKACALVKSWPVILLCVLASAATVQAEVDFDTDILPILTHAGCNSGACHGAAAGRGSFRLSLFGSVPQLDVERIAQEFEGRRVHLVHPERSLLLQKPTGQLAHEGGERLEYDGERAALIARWIAEGAARRQLRKLVGFQISPSEFVARRPGDSIRIECRAAFSDGTQRDVTALTVFTPTDSSAVTLTPAGEAVVQRPGQHTVLLRYLDRVSVVRIILPYDNPQDKPVASAAGHWIDADIAQQLAALRLPVSPRAADETLARRTWLTLTGRLPPPDELDAFLSSSGSSAAKHAQLVDRLLASEEFVDYWTFQYAQLFRVRSRAMQSEGARTFHNWLRQQVAENRPLDELVREMLLATGDAFVVGPAGFSRATNSPREQAEFISEALLGVRLRCANCHDHPLDRWTQDDYHGLAAVFARVDRGRNVQLLPAGEVTHPRTGEAARPRLPGERFLATEADPRIPLADWLTSTDNRLFARAMANRVWRSAMGRGLVEPADDLRDTNPASHPELLDRLAAELANAKYDVRALLRLILSTAAYARDSRPRPGAELDDRFYSHAISRPLPAEVFVDAVGDVTGISELFPTDAEADRAIDLVDGGTPSPALDLLGRCPRDGSCEADTDLGGMALMLHLLNGAVLNEKIAHPRGKLRESLAAGRSDAELLDEFFRSGLSRAPTSAESAYWGTVLKGASPETRQGVWEDVLWALLNSREFGTNH